MKHYSTLGLPPGGLAAIVAATFAVSTVVAPQARADSYHVVEKGESLNTVANRYHLTPDVLRSLNKLDALTFTQELPQMILCVPGDSRSIAAPLITSNTFEKSTTASTKSDNVGMRGSISRSISYVVRSGESWDDIANRHNQPGLNLSGASIAQSNGRSNGQPIPGQTVVIPLPRTVYHGSSETRPKTGAYRTVSSDETEIIDSATLSPEMNGNTWIPTARAIPDSRSQQRTVSAASGSTRGPVSLSSRGYSPSPTLDGVRVLSPQEEAPNAGRPPQPRVRFTAPPARSTRLARVAKIASVGARIRRLPEASAATLYRCSVGTEIAVIKQTGTWSAILMSDRSTGWVPTHYLKSTGQSVDISKQIITDNSNVSSGSLALKGNFSSGNPMVAQALTWMGTPYVYGGTSRRGIDCSALVQNSFRSCGYSLPRTAAEQSRVGVAVNPAALQAGDRLYFSASGYRIDHTGLYMGNGLFVHASGSGRSVIVSRLSDRHNWNIFVGARR